MTGFGSWVPGAATVDDACPFSCSAGFVKSGRACNIPRKGKYADAGIEKSCNTPTGVVGGFKEFLANTGAVSTAAGCDFSCNAGYMKDSSSRECNYPTPGTYVNNQGTESSCTNITGMTGFGSWVPGAATVDDACPFSCSAGFVKSGRACNIPRKGKYADAGIEKSCDNPTGAASGFDVFLQNPGAVDSADGCGFSCKSGYVKDASARECNYPSSGNYVNNLGAEVSCNSIATEGTAVATWQEGAASTDTDCPFSCTAGFVVDSSARECKYPALGHYADAQGAEDSCTDITSITGFGSWLQGAATDVDSCPFSCDSGYTVSGRMCQ